MPHIEVREIVKEYPGVRALNGVSLEFRVGEVHGVIGENGAGKSTLMKILAGVERATGGQLFIGEKDCKFRGVFDAMSHGVAMIHQELNLVDDLTVAENLFLGREGRVNGKSPQSKSVKNDLNQEDEPVLVGGRNRGLTLVINRKGMEAETKKWLEAVGAEFLPSTLVRNLSLAEKQLVEIAKSVSTGAEVLIMDEPTAVLSMREKASLFKLISQLKKEGKTVILISHLLGELIQNCDRISVLRDGEYVGTAIAGELDEKSLAAMMVGRELGDMYPSVPEPQNEILFTIQLNDYLITGEGKPSGEEIFSSGELQVRAGEIVGFAGLIGSGRTELWESVLGLRGKKTSYSHSIFSNKVYVSEDRKHAGLHLDFSVQDNIALPWLKRFGLLVSQRNRIKKSAIDWRERLSIKVPDVSEKVGSLSGGNQQKVSLAKWLEGIPNLIVLDEPTRGVDVGSKAQIYQIIADLASEGKAIIVISSEMQELIGLCHRVVVMKNGGIAGCLERKELTEKGIMELAAGVTH